MSLNGPKLVKDFEMTISAHTVFTAGWVYDTAGDTLSENIFNFPVYVGFQCMDVGFCVPARPPNPSSGWPGCIRVVLSAFSRRGKTQLNRGDLGPSLGIMA